MGNVAQAPDLNTAIDARIDAKLATVQTEATPRFLSEDLISKRFGIEKRALRAARARGELVGHPVGRLVCLCVAEVEAWIAGRAEPAKVKAEKAANDDPLDAAIASGRLQIGGAAFAPKRRAG